MVAYDPQIWRRIRMRDCKMPCACVWIYPSLMEADTRFWRKFTLFCLVFWERYLIDSPPVSHGAGASA